MKERLVYILSFALAFALVTGTLIYLNSRFQNIFAFNFTPVNSNNTAAVVNTTSDSTNVAKQKEPPAPVDTVKNQIAKADSTAPASKDTAMSVNKNVTVADTKKVEQPKAPINSPQEELPKVAVSKEFQKTMKDSAYVNWIKKTVKLYQEMDAKKAAKVILGYSDNIARDILFSMKKKKAAEILTEFKPEVATRIINFN